MNGAKIESVGVIGLGKMGGQLARHLAEAGFETRGYDVRAEAMTAAEADGAAATGSPAELASASDLAIVGVGFDSELEAALFGDDGVMKSPKPGSVLAVASTVAPATSAASRIIHRPDPIRPPVWMDSTSTRAPAAS